MKNNLYYLIFFIFLFNCSSKKDELLIDIQAFKKQGPEIFLEKNKKNLSKELQVITKFLNYKSFNLESWQHANYQSSNFLPHTIYNGSLSIKKKNKFFSSLKKNTYEKNILIFNNSIFYIDDLSNIFTLDLNLNLLRKLTIYKKKYFQDYLLKFSLVSDGEYLFISDNLGNIHSYDPKLNKITWSIKLGVPFVSNIILYKSNLYVINDNGKIYSFNSKNGNQNWSYESATNIVKNYGAFQIVAEQDKLIFSNDLGDLYCIDLVEKNLAWNINADENTNFLVNSNNILQFSKIVIKDNDIFFSSNKNKLFNINLSNGMINWTVDLPYPSTLTPIITPDNIINIANNGFISILNKKNGSFLYKKSFLSLIKNLIKDNKQEFILKYTFISSNYLYILSENGFFFKIDTNNLNNISYKKISKSIYSPPVIVFKNIYILDNHGVIYQVN